MEQDGEELFIYDFHVSPKANREPCKLSPGTRGVRRRRQEHDVAVNIKKESLKAKGVVSGQA
jgi:hypothetical protein